MSRKSYYVNKHTVISTDSFGWSVAIICTKCKCYDENIAWIIADALNQTCDDATYYWVSEKKFGRF